MWRVSLLFLVCLTGTATAGETTGPLLKVEGRVTVESPVISHADESISLPEPDFVLLQDKDRTYTLGPIGDWTALPKTDLSAASAKIVLINSEPFPGPRGLPGYYEVTIPLAGSPLGSLLTLRHEILPAKASATYGDGCFRHGFDVTSDGPVYLERVSPNMLVLSVGELRLTNKSFVKGCGFLVSPAKGTISFTIDFSAAPKGAEIWTGTKKSAIKPGEKATLPLDCYRYCPQLFVSLKKPGFAVRSFELFNFTDMGRFRPYLDDEEVQVQPDLSLVPLGQTSSSP